MADDVQRQAQQQGVALHTEGDAEGRVVLNPGVLLTLTGRATKMASPANAADARHVTDAPLGASNGTTVPDDEVRSVTSPFRSERARARAGAPPS